MPTLQELKAWNQAAAGLLPAIGRASFARQFLQAIETLVAFQYAFMFAYRPRLHPHPVYSTVSPGAMHEAVDRYVAASYIVNPVYNAYLAGLQSGVYRITELAPDAFFSSEVYGNLEVQVVEDEELGYRTPGWPEGQAELVVALRMPHDELIEISLSQPQEIGFSDGSIERIEAILPLLEALMLGHWEIARREVVDSPEVPILEQLIRDFGRGILTEREQQVVQFVLKGYSSTAIALSLDVSLATVKSHRQNLYSKLKISAQQELFNRFLQSIPQLRS